MRIPLRTTGKRKRIFTLKSITVNAMPNALPFNGFVSFSGKFMFQLETITFYVKLQFLDEENVTFHLPFNYSKDRGMKFCKPLRFHFLRTLKVGNALLLFKSNISTYK